MTAQTTTKAPKITYSAVGGDMDEIHKSFDSALAKLRAELGSEHRLYIDGAWVNGEGGTQATQSPIDRGVKIGSFTAATLAQVDSAVSAANAAQKKWSALPCA